MARLNLLASHEDTSRDVIHGLLKDVLDLTGSSNDGQVAPWEMAAEKFREAAEICDKTAGRNQPKPASMASAIFAPILRTVRPA